MPELLMTTVRLNPTTGEVEISGSEQFVEKTLESLESLLAKFGTRVAKSRDDRLAKEEANPKADLTETTLAKFIADKELPRNNHQVTTTAFFYYLTKEKGQSDASNDEVLKCYEDAGYPKPPRIAGIVDNIKRRTHYLQKTTKGRSKLTVQGENFVRHELPAKKAE